MDDLGKTSLVGRTLAHYRISAVIGAGGMGEVYRATDTKLGRDVALKVLPSDMARNPERLARFQREARAVAALNHPNVVTVYSVEESDNVHFITMELIEGQPLDRLISANGLPADRIIEIAGAIAEALAAAHEKAIVHRDLKPANVMVTNEGRVKVLDFGLAKDVGAETANDATLTSAGRTQAGMVMGTPAYMSPEQVSGRPLDHRSDIFSLGVVLHEMATGRRPFEGSSSAELISSILRDTPPSVCDARPELPSDLARVIRRCLEKDPRYRVQTARDVSNEFRDLARLGSHPKAVSTATSRTTAATPSSGAARIDEGFWVAVLPFKYSGGNADLMALAEGLTDDIVTNMSKFSYLRVIARSSTAEYAKRTVDVRTAAKELGARYVMEGSIRQAGAKVRIAVQLVDAGSGAGLWAETYDRAFSPEATLELLDDVVPRIVATVGDAQGILAHSMTEALRGRDPASLTPYEALLRSFGFHQHVSAEEYLAGITALENAVKQAPDHADCWAMLSWLYRAEFTHGYHSRPDSMDRSLAAARRAVSLAPSSQLAHASLASAHFFRREIGEFRAAAERALALNRMQGYTTAFMGLHFAYSGEWERGCALCERATQLNPNHPGWYWLPLAYNAYRQHQGERALEYALKINMPGLWTAQVALAVIYIQIGDMERARAAVGGLVAIRPGFAAKAREDLAIWQQPDMVEQMLGDLRKAGLEVPAAVSTPAPLSGPIPARTASGESRADEGFWVAVLPFKYTGSNADLKALAEGLSEEVITGLSRFSYLRVIGRGSTAKYSSESGDVRAIGKELGARYVMEGSLRQAGNKLRVAVQLVEGITGAHLWAENFERSLNPDAVFELQDDLVPRIVSTVADINGVLSRTMSEAVRSRDPEKLTPYEAVLRSFAYFERVTPEEMNAAIAGIESALQKAPSYADAWAMLALLSAQRYAQGFGPAADSLATGAAAARRAVEAAPANHLAWFSLSQVLFFQKEFRTFRNAAERALTLNPMDSNSLALNGEMLALSGEWERGVSLSARARQLNPHHPGWYWHSDFNYAYRQRDYRVALEIASKMNQTSNWGAWALTAAACGQLGDRDGAAKAIRELLKLRPDAVSRLREDCDKWFDAEHAAHVMEGFHKAGLDVDAGETAGLRTTASPTSSSGATRADEGFWVAVLPFKYTGNNQDLKALAEGLSEEVITGLSRFSYLRVIARGSTAKYSSESGDVRAIGKELGARYVMEASLRQAGTKLRLAVQLVDTVSGAHLWAENYERSFSPETVFEIQDDLVPRIVSTVADAYGVLPYSMSDVVRSKPLDQLTPYEAILRAIGYGYRLTPEEHAVARTCLERAVQQSPGFADGWAMLSLFCADEYGLEFPGPPDPLGRALQAARRAADAAPSSSLAQSALAKALFFRKEFQAFRSAAEQSIALNPMDGAKLANLGGLLAYSGDWERGCALVERAMQLNPRHPGYYWFPLAWNAYRKGDYRGAVNIALKINLPGFFATYEVLAAAYGQLGERDAARQALGEMLKLVPNFGKIARRKSKWFQLEMVEHMLDGLRKAGLEIPLEDEATSTALDISPSPAKTESGAARAEEGFWVAVLPFKSVGTSAELKALADGMCEDVITGLSRFSYLRVIARGSTAKYSSESGDVRAIGKELGARYVMEGSLRQAGNKLRLAVQLADTVSGTHIWAETYERAFTPESVFEVQDDLVPRVVSTVADQYGVLPRSMSDVLRSKSENALTPHEAVLRAFSYFTRITPEEHAVVRNILERAVREAPNHADTWAMLSMIYRGEFAQGYNARPDPLDRALAAAQRAVELEPTQALGHYSLATVHFFRKEIVPFRVEVERALKLNPLDASARAYLGMLTAASGEWDRGCQMVESAMQLNPNCPGYFYITGCCKAYVEGKYAEALEGVARMNMPSYFHVPALQAAALGQLGRREEAQKAVQDLLALRPDFASAARREYSKWWNPELVERMLDGLRKAGLEIPEDHASSAPVPAAQSIAVLPFANMSADPEQDYFSDGLAEEIINLLAQVSGLKVIARTSAFAFRGKEQDIRGIAEALGVNTVLEGSVRRSGSRIRVTAQLINAADGSHLWSERYDRELSDIFAVQDEISAAIAKALRVKLSRETAPQRYTPKLAAYEAYLKGRYHQAKVAPESLELARRCYEQAIELDPAFGMAHIGLAFYWMTLTHFGQHSVHEGVSAARAEVQRALQIDPSLPDGHALLGYLAALFDWDWAAAEKNFEFPMAKQASFELVRPMYSGFLYLHGDVEKAIKPAQRAIEEDPLDVWAHMNLHAYLQAAGRDDEALEQLKKVVELDPNQVVALVSMAMIYADKGNLSEALKIARRAYAIGRWFADTPGVLAALLRRNGEEEESKSVAKTLGSGETLGDARAHAVFHLLCGEIDQGADWVEKAIEQRDSSMIFYLRFVVCKGLRASHRWPKIAKMVNLPVFRG